MDIMETERLIKKMEAHNKWQDRFDDLAKLIKKRLGFTVRVRWTGQEGFEMTCYEGHAGAGRCIGFLEKNPRAMHRTMYVFIDGVLTAQGKPRWTI